MHPWTILGTLLIGIAAYLLLSGFFRTWRTYRGIRVITCPENRQPAAVRVAAFDAAKWAALAGEADLHLRSCSRWPEMAGCDEACLRQIESAPGECLVPSIVASWYAGKRCRFCHRAIENIVWHERPPAVRLPDGTTREWKDIAPQDLPSVFATGEPACWACHVFETFRREHPEMVVERARIATPQPTLAPSVSVY